MAEDDVTMEKLAQLLRLQKHHKRKRRELQDRVDRLKIACEVQKRALRVHPQAEKILSDCIRTANKPDFRITFEALLQVHDVAKSLSQGSTGLKSSDTQDRSFLDSIPKVQKDLLLQFLSEIVSSPAALGARLQALTPPQLDRLCSAHSFTARNASVLGKSTPSPNKRTSVQSLSPGYQTPQADTWGRDQVWDLCRHDALALLLDFVGLFPGHATQSRSVRDRQDDIWGSILATMLVGNQPPREKFVLKVLDALSHDTSPTGTRSLETWMLDTISSGYFLIGKENNATFQFHSQGPTAVPGSTAFENAEDFYSVAVQQLFDLIKDNQITHVVPKRVLNVCRACVAVASAVNGDAERYASFFLSQWLFSSYLLDTIITPESRGILLDDYFPETARHRILREVVLRAQRIVFNVNYSWAHSADLDLKMRAEVNTMAAIFTPVSDQAMEQDLDTDTTEYFLRTVSARDILTLVSTFFPADDTSSTLQSTPGASITKERQLHLETKALGAQKRSVIDLRGQQKSTKHNINTPRESSTHELMPDASALRPACTSLVDLLASQAGPADPLLSPQHWTLVEVSSTGVRSIDRITAVMAESSASDLQYDLDASNEMRHDTDNNNAYLDVRKSLLLLLSDDSASNPYTTKQDLSSHDAQAELIMPLKALNPYMSRAAVAKSSTNPFRRKVDNARRPLPDVVTSESASSPPSSSAASSAASSRPLSRAFEQAIRTYGVAEDFPKAYTFSQALRKINDLSKGTRNVEATLLQYFTRDVQRAVIRSKSAAARLEALVTLLERQYTESDAFMAHALDVTNKLRVKMWYCTDIRTGAPYAALEKLAQAIRDMAVSASTAAKRSEPPPLRHKGTLRPKTLNAIKKGEASVIDIMVANPVYKIENKLKDEQVDIVQAWMSKLGIENICNGEERLHRLLCEISKCLSQTISPDPILSPVLWTSELFWQDRWEGETEALHAELASTSSQGTPSLLSRPSSSGSDHYQNQRRSVLNITTTSLSSQETTSEGSPAGIQRSPGAVWSPTGFRSHSPLSNFSPPSRAWSPHHLRSAVSKESFQSTAKVKALLSDLRKSVLGLLVSDIMRLTFPNGSETDVAFFHGAGQAAARSLSGRAHSLSSTRPTKPRQDKTGGPSKSQRGKDTSVESEQPGKRHDERQTRGSKSSSKDISPPSSSSSPFDLGTAKRHLCRRFDLSNGPYAKLKVLETLHNLVLSSAHKSDLKVSKGSPTPDDHLRASANLLADTFRSPDTRPSHLYRDLQTIASLVPASDIQDTSPTGKAFWAAALAAVTLKEEMTVHLIETADTAIAEYKQARRAAAAVQPQPPSLPGQLSHSSLAPSAPAASPPPDASAPIEGQQQQQHPLARAAAWLRLAAAQGQPVAQRELAALYLTHADLLPRVLAPMATTGDVFSTVAGRTVSSPTSPTLTTATSVSAPKEGDLKVGEGGETAGSVPQQGVGGSVDAETLCVAVHWMRLAAAGGDKVARSFMDARE